MSQLTDIDGRDFKLTDVGAPRPSLFGLECAAGRIPGKSAVFKYGSNFNIGLQTTPEHIWSGGGLYTFFPEAAQTMTLQSTSANDTALGTGARTVIIFGLDVDWKDSFELVTLNGLTPVPLSRAYVRVYRMRVLEVGAVGWNEGDLTVESTVDAAVGAHISIGKNNTLQAIYTIPGDKTGYLNQGFVGMSRTGTGRTADVTYRTRQSGVPGKTYGFAVQFDLAVSTQTNINIYPFHSFQKLKPKMDLVVICESVSSNDTGIFAGFELILEGIA